MKDDVGGHEWKLRCVQLIHLVGAVKPVEWVIGENEEAVSPQAGQSVIGESERRVDTVFYKGLEVPDRSAGLVPFRDGHLGAERVGLCLGACRYPRVPAKGFGKRRLQVPISQMLLQQGEGAWVSQLHKKAQEVGVGSRFRVAVKLFAQDREGSRIPKAHQSLKSDTRTEAIVLPGQAVECIGRCGMRMSDEPFRRLPPQDGGPSRGKQVGEDPGDLGGFGGGGDLQRLGIDRMLERIEEHRSDGIGCRYGKGGVPLGQGRWDGILRSGSHRTSSD